MDRLLHKNNYLFSDSFTLGDKILASVWDDLMLASTNF